MCVCVRACACPCLQEGTDKWQVDGFLPPLSNPSLLYRKQTWIPEAAVSEAHALMNRNESRRGVAIRFLWTPASKSLITDSRVLFVSFGTIMV